MCVCVCVCARACVCIYKDDEISEMFNIRINRINVIGEKELEISVLHYVRSKQLKVE